MGDAGKINRKLPPGGNYRICFGSKHSLSRPRSISAFLPKTRFRLARNIICRKGAFAGRSGQNGTSHTGGAIHDA